MEDVLPAQPHLIHQRPVIHARRPRLVVHDGVEDLGEDDDLLPRDLVPPQELADDLLGLAVRVRVGRVPGVDARVVGGLEQADARLGVERPGTALPGRGAEDHAAEDDLGDFEAAVAESGPR